MGLKQWHWGKILMLWIATPFVMFAVFFVVVMIVNWLYAPLRLIEFETIRAVAPILSFLLVPVPFVIMVGVTWKWLSGKERPPI